MQSELLEWLGVHLVRLGPGVLFAICLLETAVFAGIVLPVGALIAFSALLSARGILDPADVVFVALTGALCGDQLGFVMGRWFSFGAGRPSGRIARLWAGAMQRTEVLLAGRGAVGISLARVIPFVRTIMPWFAGRSKISWGRFFLFDLLGVLLWGLVYIGGGFMAGRGWDRVAERFGEGVGALLLMLAVVLAIWLSRKVVLVYARRRRPGR